MFNARQFIKHPREFALGDVVSIQLLVFARQAQPLWLNVASGVICIATVVIVAPACNFVTQTAHHVQVHRQLLLGSAPG